VLDHGRVPIRIAPFDTFELDDDYGEPSSIQHGEIDALNHRQCVKTPSRVIYNRTE
jgi:hypothetical protein